MNPSVICRKNPNIVILRQVKKKKKIEFTKHHQFSNQKKALKAALFELFFVSFFITREIPSRIFVILALYFLFELLGIHGFSVIDLLTTHTYSSLYQLCNLLRWPWSSLYLKQSATQKWKKIMYLTLLFRW